MFVPFSWSLAIEDSKSMWAGIKSPKAAKVVSLFLHVGARTSHIPHPAAVGGITGRSTACASPAPAPCLAR